MKSLTQFIKESFNDYVVNYDNGHQNHYSAKSIQDAKSFLKSKEDNLKYFDIHKGSNTSEIEGLICWFGEGGYWYNYSQEKEFNGSQKKGRDLRLAEKAKKYEVKSVDEIK